MKNKTTTTTTFDILTKCTVHCLSSFFRLDLSLVLVAINFSYKLFWCRCLQILRQQNIPRANSLGTKLAGRTQRFYFDTKSGVILPGDTLNFPFVFKSANAGIFTETWELMTKPILCGGAPIRIHLRGEELYIDYTSWTKIRKIFVACAGFD